MLLNYALEYVIWKRRENQEGLKLDGTHQLQVYTDDLNGRKQNTINAHIDAPLDSSKEVGLDVKPEKN